MQIPATHKKLLRVFEHQSLRIGEEVNGYIFSKKHFEALARFSEKHGGKYYSLIFNGIKFSHYVGALQVGDLTIEILPKVDRGNPSEQWHDVLMDMLRACRLLKVDTLASAQLRLRTNSILELYFEIFIEEVEKLLRRGLFRSYRKVEKNSRYLRGKIIFQKHIQKNIAHQERFFTASQQFDYDHLLNRILRRALEVLETLTIVPTLLSRIKKLKEYFPKSNHENFTELHFQKIMNDRKTRSYHTALEIARLLVLNYSPDLRGGKHHLLAILFDMNLLFEEYVFRQLKRLETNDLEILRQQQKSFWQRRKIQPDIVLKYFGKKYVLDTKWKVLAKPKPAMEDLKQMYIYNQYFNAERSLLLFPKINTAKNLPPTPYLSTDSDGKMHYCQVCFLEIIKDGKLNRNLGQDILEQIEMANTE